MNTPALFLDLDRTLLDTPRLMAALQAAAEQLYGSQGVTARALSEDYAQYSSYIGEQHYYRFFDHLQHYGIETEQAAKDLRQALQAKDFLYADTHVLLDFITEQHIPATILTFGASTFQLFKASLAPRLAALPIHTLLTEKTDYIQQLFHASADKTAPTLLVDDRLVRATLLPSHCQIILIDRTQPERLRRGSSFTSINSLEALKELM